MAFSVCVNLKKDPYGQYKKFCLFTNRIVSEKDCYLIIEINSYGWTAVKSSLCPSNN